MKYLPLIWSGLWRKPARSLFTLLSVIVAFVLFGLLEGLNAGFSKAIGDQHLDRLITDPRVPGGEPMPMSALKLIESVPGVIGVAPRSIFFGHFQEPKNGLFALATDAQRWFSVRPEFAIAKEQLELFRTTRTGLIVTPAVRNRFGWRIGDRIPLRSRLLQQNGSGEWTFDLVGEFDSPENPGQSFIALINYDYYDEARSLNRGTADRFIIRIDDPERSVETSGAIDRLFANSQHETRTQSEREMAETMMKQVGDTNFYTKAIVSAVFFTLLFLTANTMMQSVRERIPEFGVLKTMGFTDSSVLKLVLCESFCMCLLASLVGLGIAGVIFPFLRDIIGPMRLENGVILSGIAYATLIAIVSAFLPAWRVKRLRIVDAIAGR